jgi:hypothetical protein
LGGSCGSDDCGESIVVANARVHGVLDLEMVWKVEAESKHRDLGIEAAIMDILGNAKKERSRRE